MKPKLGPDASSRVLAAVNSTVENVKSLYKVRTEMRITFNNLLKVRSYFFLNIYEMPLWKQCIFYFLRKCSLSASAHDIDSNTLM